MVSLPPTIHEDTSNVGCQGGRGKSPGAGMFGYVWHR